MLTPKMANGTFMGIPGTLALVAAHLGRNGPDRQALIASGGDRRMSYAALGDAVCNLAHGLGGAGVEKDEPVILLGPNSPDWVIAALALLRRGAVPVPLDTLMSPADLAHAIRDSGACRAFVSHERLASLDGASDRPLNIIRLDHCRGQGRGKPWTDLTSPGPIPPVVPDDRAVLFYTSGTTGAPKGVPLTHANLVSNISALIDERVATADDRIALPLPLFHVYPFTVGMLTPLTLGAAVIFPAGLTGPQILAALRDERATMLIGVPRLYNGLVEAIGRRMRDQGRVMELIGRSLLATSRGVHRLTGHSPGRVLFASVHRRLAPDLHTLASGGAKLDPRVAKTLEAFGWTILTGYGLTETSPILTVNLPSRGNGDRHSHAGWPLSGVDLRIDTGSFEAYDDGRGEVIARGPNVFAGYHQRPDATAEAFKGGWFRTGDLGRLRPDGALELLGRLSEILVLSGGKNVRPDEIETALERSPQIREAGVFERDGALAALIVPEGQASAATLRAEAQRCCRDLPSYKRIRDLAITTTPLPRTPLGKIRHHQLKDLAARLERGEEIPEDEILSAEDHHLIETGLTGRAFAWLKSRFPDSRVALSSDLTMDLGIDSMEWISLTLELQTDLGVQLSEDTLARVHTVRDLLLEIGQAPAAGEVEAVTLTERERARVRPTGPLLRLLRHGLGALNRLAFRTLWPIDVQGRDTLPDSGPFVLVPNHASYLDAFALAAELPPHLRDDVFWAGLADILYGGPLRRAFSRITQIFPVDPARRPGAGLAYGETVLKDHHILVWFPEGRRSRDGSLQTFMPGLGVLLDRVPVPVIPVWIEGTFDVWPPHRRWPRRLRKGERLRLSFGEPVSPDTLHAEGKAAANSREIAAAVHGRLIALGSQVQAAARDTATPAA